MRGNVRKCETEVSSAIEIPHLKFRDSDADDCYDRPVGFNDHASFLGTAPLGRNSEFLKEKSLYRYAISRKGSKNDFSRSQANILSTKQQVNRTSEIREPSSINGCKSIQQYSVVSGDSKGKGPHFRRRSRNQSQVASPLVSIKTIETPAEKHPKGNQDKLKKTSSSNTNFKSTPPLNSSEHCQSEIQTLRQEILGLREDSQNLRKGYNKKCQELELMELRIDVLSRENKRLLDDSRRTCLVHSDSFIDESKLESQLVFRDALILQLQSKLKYSELEILTLKKLKTEQSCQSALVLQLQKRNRNLEDRVDVLTRMKSKRSNLRKSKMSQFSDITLNFSADDDEFEKPYLELRTSEKTPQKLRILRNRRLISQEAPEEELLTPLWIGKRRKG